MGRLPHVSVVIPAYNEEKFLGRTLASLQCQDYRGPVEIIVVDNASTDATAQIAKAYGALVVTEHRKGLPFARQAGFNAAKGSLIASTDADDILPPNWISRWVTELTNHPEAVAVGGWFKLENGPIIPRLLVNFLSAPMLFCYALLFWKVLLQDQNFMVRRNAFRTVGGYNNLDAMHEDLLLAQRLRTVGSVRFYYGRRWSVTSSPRRWNRGFLHGVMPYFANAVTYGCIGKLPIKDFTDIREEVTTPLQLQNILIPLCAIVLCFGAFIAIPKNPVHAKISPFTYKAKHELLETMQETPFKVITAASKSAHKHAINPAI